MSSASSFRDPAGTLVFEADRVVRTVRAEFVPDTVAFLNSAIAKKWLSRGNLIGTEVLGEPQVGRELRLAHPRIFFPSYPWEWTPAQLGAAAELTLDLCEDVSDFFGNAVGEEVIVRVRAHVGEWQHGN